MKTLIPERDQSTWSCRIFHGFLTDWIRVGLNDEEYIKETPLYFHTFQDIFDMLINGLVIGIDRKNLRRQLL